MCLRYIAPVKFILNVLDHMLKATNDLRNLGGTMSERGRDLD